MNEQKIKFPIRFKLIIILTVLPVIALTLYLFLAVDLFKNDKIAYVLDASVTTARAIASQVRAQVESLISSIQPIIEGYDFESNKFDRISKSLFLKDPKYSLVTVYEIGGETGVRKVGFLQKANLDEAFFQNFQNQINSSIYLSQKDGLAFIPISDKSDEIITGILHRSPDMKRSWVFLTLSRAPTLFEVFRNSDIYKKYLLGPEKKVLISAEPEGRLNTDLQMVKENLKPEGSKEFKTSDGKDWLTAYADVGIAHLMVASFVEKRAALIAVEYLWVKSIVFFIALISGTVIVSVFASRKLTMALRQLYLATRKVADGNFDIKVAETTNDEVGSLARGFNAMAKEVSRLIDETAEKARMENELKTAQVVQENLLPPLSSKMGPVHIAGFFEPASEIGGDWWHYCQIGEKIFFWIGDATGHGAPAALITSAAKSASAIIECFPDIAPSKALYLLNRAIYETSKSKFMMTFFLGALDLKSGLLTYSNASHDPPYLLRRKDKPLKKKDIILLNEINNPRLGQNKATGFRETSLQLEQGDTIVFYTDGVLDLANKEGELWGERRFTKALLDAIEAQKSSEAIIELVRSNAFEFRKEAPLNDDFTFFLCRFDKSA